MKISFHFASREIKYKTIQFKCSLKGSLFLLGPLFTFFPTFICKSDSVPVKLFQRLSIQRGCGLTPSVQTTAKSEKLLKFFWRINEFCLFGLFPCCSLVRLFVCLSTSLFFYTVKKQKIIHAFNFSGSIRSKVKII